MIKYAQDFYAFISKHQNVSTIAISLGAVCVVGFAIIVGLSIRKRKRLRKIARITAAINSYAAQERREG